MIFILFGIISDEEKDLVNKIFLKMNVKMYNISYNVLKSNFDAEEAVAQTFLKIINNIEKISLLPSPQIEPYCVIILKNETMNIIKQRNKTVYVEDIDYFEQNIQGYDIEEEFIKAANRKKLFSCINKLSDDDKYFIHLRFVNDMSYKNISNLLGITEDAAKKRGQRIFKKLRSYYEEGGDMSVENN
ncbi:sigma-70 family RNA polymerase sigma factor [Lachnospiraceae bacterium 54-53]